MPRTLFWTIETVLFATNERKLQLTSEAPGALAWKPYLCGQNLKKKELHEDIAQLELLNTPAGREKKKEVVLFLLIGSEKNRFDRPKQRPRQRPQP